MLMQIGCKAWRTTRLAVNQAKPARPPSSPGELDKINIDEARRITSTPIARREQGGLWFQSSRGLWDVSLHEGRPISDRSLGVDGDRTPLEVYN